MEADVESSKSNTSKVSSFPSKSRSGNSLGSSRTLVDLLDHDPEATCHLAQAIRDRAQAIA